MSYEKLLNDIYNQIIHLHDKEIIECNGSLLPINDRRFIKIYSNFFLNGNNKSINTVPLYKIIKKFLKIKNSNNELNLKIVYFLMDYFELSINTHQNRGFLSILELTRIKLMYKKIISKYIKDIPSDKKIEFFKEFINLKMERVIFLESIDDEITFPYTEDFNLPITLVKTANEDDFLKLFADFIATDHSLSISLYGKNTLISFFILSYNIFGKKNYNKFKKQYPKIYEFLTTTRFGYMKYGFIMPMNLAGNKKCRDEALNTIQVESLINLKKIINDEIKINLNNPNDLSKMILVYSNKKILKTKFLKKTSEWITKKLCTQKIDTSSFQNSYFQLCNFLCFFSDKNILLDKLTINTFLIDILPDYYVRYIHLYDNINHLQVIDHINFLIDMKTLTKQDISNILSVIYNNQFNGINVKKIYKLYNLYSGLLVNEPTAFFKAFSGQFRIKINDQSLLVDFFNNAVKNHNLNNIQNALFVEICNDLLINPFTPDSVIKEIISKGFYNESTIFSNFFKHSNYKDIKITKVFYDRINSVLHTFTTQLNSMPISYRKAGLCRELLSFINIDVEVLEDIYKTYMSAPKDNFWIGALLATHKKTPNQILFQLSTTHNKYVKLNKNFRGYAQSILDMLDS
jgi:hypothetical protein